MDYFLEVNTCKGSTCIDFSEEDWYCSVELRFKKSNIWSMYVGGGLGMGFPSQAYSFKAGALQ